MLLVIFNSSWYNSRLLTSVFFPDSCHVQTPYDETCFFLLQKEY